MGWGSKWQGSVACHVEMPVENVGEIVKFAGLSSWDPHAIESSDIVSGDGYCEGSIRCVVFKDGNGYRGILYERMLSYDFENLLYTYAMGENPFGYHGYKAAIEVQDSGDGSTSVQWSVELDPMDNAELT